jgi:TonB-dependent receptor
MKKLSLLFVVFVQAIAFGQSNMGYIVGNVIDSETGEPIVRAPVFDISRTYLAMTDFDGYFSIPVKAGNYTFKCKYVGYENDSTIININDSDTIHFNFKMNTLGMLKEVLVVSRRSTSSAVATLTAEKEAKTVTDGIGKEEMSDRDVSTAADAVSKVPGATVEDGKYVYVRGLSDRYSKTLLNGADIPGLDPNRNSVQMDLFPSSLIQSITVYKSFSPDLPANFTGGLVDIKTKEFPENFTVYFSTKLGYNPQSSFNDNFLTQNGKSLDALALGASQRSLPESISNLSVSDFPSPGINDQTLNEYGKAFGRDFEPTKKMSGLDNSYTFSIGNSIGLNSDNSYPKLGFFIGTSYKKSFKYYDNGQQGRYKLTGDYQNTDFLNPELSLNDTQGTEEVIWGALGNLSLQFNENNKVSFVINRFQNGINSARYLEGQNFADANDLYFQTRTLFYQQRELTNLQLKGEHYFNLDKEADVSIKMNWIGSFTNSVQKTPELKFFTNDYTVNEDGDGDTLFDLQPALYSDPSQFYRLMAETNLNTKIDFEIPLKAINKKDKSKSVIKVGGYYLNKSREFTEKRYDFVTQSGNNIQYTGSVNDYVADENFNSGDYTNGFLHVQNASEKRNNYIGLETNIAAYALADLNFGTKLSVRAGARMEQSDIYSRSLNPNDTPGYLNNLDVLPSINSTFDLIEDTLKIRFGYSRTLARPTFRELAPFSSFDFVGGNVYVGNPDLKRTLIDNIDLRFEYYPSYRENISIGLFAKNFTNPIERAFNPEASNAELTWKNVDNAKVYGAEIEFSKHLKGGKLTKNLTLGGNFTFVKSIVSIPEKEFVVIQDQNPEAKDTREMFGQSPFIVNAFINYKNKSGINANINFGVNGKQISVVTIGATPNVYQQSRPLLGFNISKNIKNFSVKFSATNLLDSKYLNTYSFKNQDYVFSSYTRGRSFSVKLAYNFVKNN